VIAARDGLDGSSSIAGMLLFLRPFLLQAAADSATRAQAEAAVQRQEALASLEVASSELENVQQQLAMAQVRL
jgi:hypothetical protein